MTVTIHVGDCIDVLRTLPAESVHCVVTSPPYFGLRDYGVDGQIGLEESPDEYVAKLVRVFREVRRVLHPTGVCWLNLGDSYWGSWGNSGNRPELDGKGGTQREKNVEYWNRAAWDDRRERPPTSYKHDLFKPKDLMMIPARVALALQADGWWLRSQVIWHKPNAMPESVTDRPTTDYECVYLLAKEARYFYDADAIREEYSDSSGGWQQRAAQGKVIHHTSSMYAQGGEVGGVGRGNHAGRNKRTVWTIPTRPYSAAHFATFPPDLVEPMILAGTSERGACPYCGAQWQRIVERGEPQPTKENPNPVLPYAAGSGHNNGTGATTLHMQRESVTVDWQPTCDCGEDPVPSVILDPFGGAGTTGLVADRIGRDAILIELNPEYASMAARRIYDDAGMFADVQIVEATP